MAACLKKAGWDVVVGTDGSISPVGGVPVSQSGAYDEEVAACEEPLSSDITPLEDLTTSQWADLYHQESETAECLRAQGVDVPAIPSQATFEDRYKGDDPWTSYRFVGAVDESTWNALNSACPQPYIQ